MSIILLKQILLITCSFTSLITRVVQGNDDINRKVSTSLICFNGKNAVLEKLRKLIDYERIGLNLKVFLELFTTDFITNYNYCSRFYQNT